MISSSTILAYLAATLLLLLSVGTLVASAHIPDLADWERGVIAFAGFMIFTWSFSLADAAKKSAIINGGESDVAEPHGRNKADSAP